MAVNDRLLDLLGSLDKETPGERETKRKYLRPKKRDLKSPTLDGLPRDRSQPRDLEAKVSRGASLNAPRQTFVDRGVDFVGGGLRALGAPDENVR